MNSPFDGSYDEEKYSAPMPWIGMYVAAGCLICNVGMAADAVKGFYSKKLWLPCKFFTLNAASLTLVAVAMKLPVDLTDSMPGHIDQLAKLSSIVFMCTTMGNLSISIGSMNGNEIFMNLIALGILVVTILVNVCIQLHTGVVILFRLRTIMVMILMFSLLLLLCFSALIVATTKDYLGKRCDELHNVMRKEQIQENNKTVIEKLKDDVRKYWIIIETGNPQFVMARSATSCTSGILCCLAALVLLEYEVSIYITRPSTYGANSVYKWTTGLIFWVQSVGVILGTIAPVLRWFVAVGFKGSKGNIRSHFEGFKIEKYWIQELLVWKERSLGFGSQRCRKVAHVIKNQFLNICIGVQILIVVLSKAVQLLSIFLAIPLFSCWQGFTGLKRKLMLKLGVKCGRGSKEEGLGGEMKDFSRYVLLLEGEEELPQSILMNINQALDDVILEGKRKKPKYVVELLDKCTVAFDGVGKFDSDSVPCLYSEDPPHCWTMPVATLTSIALALHGVNSRNRDWLLQSVSEGLLLAKLVERNLNSIGDSKYSRNAADLVWVGVACYGKWLDIDLQKMALQGKTAKETLQELANKAKEIVLQFAKNTGGGLIVSPINWPEKVVAANSMYRVCNTVLLASDENDESLFQELVTMIADVLGACLTNLPRVITTKYNSRSIEERARGIPHAARLLGETEEILLLLQRYPQLPAGLDPDKTININEWRAVMNQGNSLAFTYSSENVFTSSSHSDDELCISIDYQDA